MHNDNPTSTLSPTPSSTPHRIGIDIGRVLICPTIDGQADTRFLGQTLEHALLTPPAPGAFSVVAELVAASEGRAWLVSKCGPSVEAKTRAWLDHQHFWARTGMARDHLRFCRKRHQKAHHARDLGLTVMIDDRSDVLVHLRGLLDDLLLFGEQARPAPAWATPVADWAAVARWFQLSPSTGSGSEQHIPSLRPTR